MLAPVRRACARRLCNTPKVSLDPVASNPEHYSVVFENERVRVLEYNDQPGEATTPHSHPDSVMYTLSDFTRLLVSGDNQRTVNMQAGVVSWLPAQEHSGENIGETPTHALFVELKGGDAASAPGPTPADALGPEVG